VAALFVDECVSLLIVDDLRHRGCDVACASYLCPGEPDEKVLALAAAAGRVVITDDWGFGELAIRQSQPAFGVIILSLYELPAGVRERYASDKIVEIIDRIKGHLAIIEPGRIRVRPLPSRQDD
jgi:predicted nuclease of predicted toxin-antitoxin system